MQDLNDKITGGELTADEWNEVPSEIQNVIESGGIALSGADLNQLGKGISNYVANNTFYTDAGAVNAAVLAVIGSKQGPTAYVNGMIIRFIPVTNNTGAMTVNVNGLGLRNLRFSNGDALTSGELSTAKVTEAVFHSASGAFRLTNQLGSTTRAGELQLSDSNTSTSTTLAATIGQVTKRARKASAETISGVWTWADNTAARFGAGADLTIFSDGANGILNMRSGADLFLTDAGVTRIQYDNSALRLEVITGSIRLKDNLFLDFGNSSDVQVRYSTASPVNSLVIDLSSSADLHLEVDGTIVYQYDNSDDKHLFAKAVEMQDNVKLHFGNDADIDLDYDTDADAFDINLSGTADFRLRDNGGTIFQFDNGEDEFVFSKDIDFGSKSLSNALELSVTRTSVDFPCYSARNNAATSSTFQPMMWFKDAAGNIEGAINTSSTNTQYLDLSDPRLKTEFVSPTPEELWNSFNSLMDCYGKYSWLKAPEAGELYGFNAHKLIDAGFTNLATEGRGSRNSEIKGEEVTAAMVDYSKVVPYLMGVIDDLQKRVKELEK